MARTNNSVRLCVVCEGQTEGEFVSKCLAPTLAEAGVYAYPSLIKTGMGKSGGGDVTVERTGLHLANEYPNFDYLTTLVDLYGFSKRAGRSKLQLETDILCETQKQRPEIDTKRVIPYVQRYEFEGLLFSDPQEFEWVFDGWNPKAKEQLNDIANAFETPEDINNGPNTAPSKRLEAIFGSTFKKTTHGPIIAEEIGLDTIRQKCPEFSEWVQKLQALTQ